RLLARRAGTAPPPRPAGAQGRAAPEGRRPRRRRPGARARARRGGGRLPGGQPARRDPLDARRAALPPAPRPAPPAARLRLGGDRGGRRALLARARRIGLTALRGLPIVPTGGRG